MTRAERIEELVRILRGSEIEGDGCFVGSETAEAILSFGPEVIGELEEIISTYVEGDGAGEQLFRTDQLAMAYLVLTGLHSPQRGAAFMASKSPRVHRAMLEVARPVFGPWLNGKPLPFSVPLGTEFRDFVSSSRSSPDPHVSRLANWLWPLWNPTPTALP